MSGTTSFGNMDGVTIGAVRPGPANFTTLLANVSGATVQVPGGTTGRPLATRFAAVFDALDFGLVGNGITDDGPAIQLAVNTAAAAGGGIVRLPAMPILWNTQVTVIGGPVLIVGQGWSEIVASGTRVTTTAQVSPLVFSGPFATGCGISRVSFQQPQPVAAAGWAPTVFPPTILITGTIGEVSVEDCLCYNCYWFIQSLNSGRLRLSQLRGQPLFCGIYIDSSYDTTHVDGSIHFWPYWCLDPNVISWQQSNADALHLLRVDGFQAHAIFVLGYRSGLRLSYSTSASPPGGVNLAQIGSLYVDACLYGIYNDGNACSAHIGSLYTGGETLSGGVLASSRSIYLHASNSSLSVANAKLYCTSDYMIVMDQVAGGNVLQIGNLELDDFNPTGTSAAIYSCTASTPNIIHIASFQMFNSNGGSLVNNCNAWVQAEGNTPCIHTGVASGSTVTLSASMPFNIIEPGGPLASLTIALPPNYEPNREITVLSAQNIAFVTVTAGPTALVSPPTSLTSGTAKRFLYQAATITAEGTNAYFAL